MPAKTIAGLISTSGELKTLAARTRALSRLQAVYASAAPPELAAASRVKSLRAGTLCIAARNSAVAAKLRQLVPSMLASIRTAEPDVTELRVGVEVAGRKREAPGRREKPTLSPATVDRFAALAAEVPPGRLKTALERLVRRHRHAGRRSR